MIDQVTEQHLQRLKLATTQKLRRKDLSNWVQNNTYLNGRKFSIAGHEYQDRIMSEESPEVVIKKSAQIGISEMSLRMTLGLVSIMPNFSAIYTMPSASVAGVYTKTRLDPIIQGSPFLKEAVGTDLDSSEVKQLGPNSFMYMKGAAVGNAAISVSADMLVHDELSFSDPLVIEAYSSRLIHSAYKWRIKLSTPTFPGDAIDKAFQSSRRHYNMAKCSHCGHFWLPDYYNDVRIPGYSGDLRAITKKTIHTTRYEEAYVACPKCGKSPDLSPAYREWVCENNTQRHIAAGFGLSPFDCPTFITVPSLIIASTSYESRALFENFHLGQCAVDADSGITEADVDAAGLLMEDSPFTTHVMGGDMGLICRVFVAGVTSAGEVMIVHTEQIPIAIFRVRYAALCKQFRITAKVLDAQPYVETILNLQSNDPNLFAGMFLTKKGLALYDTVTRDENEKLGKVGLRQVSINKNAVLDVILADLRDKKIMIRRTKDWEDVKTQLTAMKRVKQMTDDGVMYVWRKPEDGDDHFHHALVYVWLAAQIRGAVVRAGHLPPMVGSFKLKSAVTPRMGTGMR